MYGEYGGQFQWPGEVESFEVVKDGPDKPTMKVSLHTADPGRQLPPGHYSAGIDQVVKSGDTLTFTAGAISLAADGDDGKHNYVGTGALSSGPCVICRKYRHHTNHHQNRSQEMGRAAELEARIDRLARHQAEAEAELARLATRPAEPITDDAGEAPVLRFDVQFVEWGAVYKYAAIRTDGLWYTTGPKSPKGYTWDQLFDWFDGMYWVSVRWLVTEYEEL